MSLYEIVLTPPKVKSFSGVRAYLTAHNEKYLFCTSDATLVNACKGAGFIMHSMEELDALLPPKAPRLSPKKKAIRSERGKCLHDPLSLVRGVTCFDARTVSWHAVSYGELESSIQKNSGQVYIVYQDREATDSYKERKDLLVSAQLTTEQPGCLILRGKAPYVKQWQKRASAKLLTEVMESWGKPDKKIKEVVYLRQQCKALTVDWSLYKKAGITLASEGRNRDVAELIQISDRYKKSAKDGELNKQINRYNALGLLAYPSQQGLRNKECDVILSMREAYPLLRFAAEYDVLNRVPAEVVAYIKGKNKK